MQWRAGSGRTTNQLQMPMILVWVTRWRLVYYIYLITILNSAFDLNSNSNHLNSKFIVFLYLTYLTAFGVFRRPPWKRAILQTNSPCTGPARTWLSLKPWLLRLTHFLCQKCFCGKEGLEAKTLVSFKARLKFKTKAYAYV